MPDTAGNESDTLPETPDKAQADTTESPDTAGNESDTLPETPDEAQAETAESPDTAVSYPPCNLCGGESKPVGEPTVRTYRHMEIITMQLVKCCKCGIGRFHRSTEKYTPAS